LIAAACADEVKRFLARRTSLRETSRRQWRLGRRPSGRMLQKKG